MKIYKKIHKDVADKDLDLDVYSDIFRYVKNNTHPNKENIFNIKSLYYENDMGYCVRGKIDAIIFSENIVCISEAIYVVKELLDPNKFPVSKLLDESNAIKVVENYRTYSACDGVAYYLVLQVNGWWKDELVEFFDKCERLLREHEINEQNKKIKEIEDDELLKETKAYDFRLMKSNPIKSKKAFGYYNFKINLEDKESRCEPSVIENLISGYLINLGYKSVDVECVDYDINEV